MRSFELARLIAGVCLFSICAADLILLQPDGEGYQLVRTRRQAAPHVNVHSIPKTSFTCDEKKLGEYYADMETRCQVYHICLPGVSGKLSAMSFVCPNGTIFSQASRVCSPFDRVYCQIQERFYESLHGDLSNKRTDYGNLNDYAGLKYHGETPRVTHNNDISDEDDDEDERPATPAPPPRRQRPSGRSRQQQPRPAVIEPEVPVAQPPPRRQPSFRPQPPPIPSQDLPPPPPPQPQPAVVRRQPSFRPVPTLPVVDEPETTAPPQGPQRNAAPTVRRPVFRNQVYRGPAPTTTEEPATTLPPRNLRARNQNRGSNNRNAAPVIPVVPQPPPVDLSIPEGIQYAQPNRGPLLPTIRLPPGLRGVARPLFPGIEENTEIPVIPTEFPQGRPAPFQPNFARPLLPLSPITRPSPLPTTLPPTTQAPSEQAPTTTVLPPAPQGNNNNDYEYVYDYDFNPSGNTRSRRHVEEVY